MTPLARNTDPATSHAAAACAPIHAHEQRILWALSAGQAGKDEIASRCGLGPVAVARRMKAMETEGLVRRTGFMAISDSGRLETQWMAV